MLSRQENDLLTRTGPGTPMGELLRRYWIPALLSEEIPEPDCPPVRVRLLGEELVAFRDSKGRVGLLDEHCSHRGTSLFYGRNEECGLRCIYHGWKYDVEGNVLETPAEPPDSNLRYKVHHPSYPCQETAGMIFTYMGPKDKMPLLPEYDWTRLPPDQTFVVKSFQECNYLQGLEGDCDSSHISYLHSSARELYRQDGRPVLLAEETDFGVRMVAIRKAGPETNYVRITNFLMPSTGHVSAKSNRVHYWAPIDDTHSWKYSFSFTSQGRPPEKEEQLFLRGEVGADFRKIRNIHNDYLQERRRQKAQTYTGIEGFLAQDSCVTETMGSIYDRTKEHLGKSDTTVITIRRFLLKAVRSLQEGEEPPCLIHDPKQVFRRPVSTGALLPSNASWRQLLIPADTPQRGPLKSRN